MWPGEIERRKRRRRAARVILRWLLVLGALAGVVYLLWVNMDFFREKLSFLRREDVAAEAELPVSDAIGEPVSTGTDEEADGQGADASDPESGPDAGGDGSGRKTPMLAPGRKVRGIYVTGRMAGTSGMDQLVQLVDETELNAMVIDVKDDEGRITFSMENDWVNRLGADTGYIGDIAGLMATLKTRNIYTIARIVCFKDPVLAAGEPDLALKSPNGVPVTDDYGLAWVNPCKEGVWEYLTGVALSAAEAGFDEIQFDYVRFPIGSVADAADYGVDFSVHPKEEFITGFLEYATARLHDSGVVVTADVFGTIIGSAEDVSRVGQNYPVLGATVDVLSPMVYPSHYGPGVFGLEVPDAHPYETVLSALQASAQELSAIPESDRAYVRPWLQAFTASWVSGHISYNGPQVRAQIKAVYDAGYEEWILWNSSNRYSREGLERGGAE